MSTQRRQARTERERLAAQRADEARATAHRAAQERAKHDRRRMVWRRLRLWQHGPAFHRRREQWGVLAVIAFVVLLVVYFVTGSVVDVFGTALALVICAPVLILLVVDRSHK